MEWFIKAFIRASLLWFAAGVTSAGGVLFAIGVVFWAWNLWRTFDAAEARERTRTESGQRQLPTRES